MKKNILLKTAAGLLLAAPAFSLAADDLPKAPAFARYEAMKNKSPFAVATAVVPPPQAPNFAKDLYIANAAKLEDEGVVTLNSSTDKNFKEYLTTKGPTQTGYAISNIEWSDRVGETKVTITKDGQVATLSFNQALLSTPVASMPVLQPQITPALVPQGGGVQPNPYANQNMIKPAPIPTLPTPPPRTRGVIQRNPPANAMPTPPPQQQPMQILPDEQ